MIKVEKLPEGEKVRCMLCRTSAEGPDANTARVILNVEWEVERDQIPQGFSFGKLASKVRVVEVQYAKLPACLACCGRAETELRAL